MSGPPSAGGNLCRAPRSSITASRFVPASAKATGSSSGAHRCRQPSNCIGARAKLLRPFPNTISCVIVRCWRQPSACRNGVPVSLSRLPPTGGPSRHGVPSAAQRVAEPVGRTPPALAGRPRRATDRAWRRPLGACDHRPPRASHSARTTGVGQLLGRSASAACPPSRGRTARRGKHDPSGEGGSRAAGR
jgi:hypothetical protein